MPMALGLALLAMWTASMPEPPSAEPPSATPPSATPPSATPPSSTPSRKVVQAKLQAPSPAPAVRPREPLPHEALAAASPKLRHCARSADSEVMYELAVTPGVANFTGIDILGADAEGHRCIRNVFEEIRFSPPNVAEVLIGGIKQ